VVLQVRDTKICAECGITYERKKGYSRTQWAASRYCSRTCQHAAAREERPLCACGCGERVALPRSRYRPGHNPQHHRRKVFVLHTIRGKPRWYITTPGAGPAQWARVVMERLIGRQLTSAEVVHHINGDSTDDRPENLRLFASHAEHMRHEFREGRLTGLALGPVARRQAA
jgi:hypothetical protein